MRKDQDRKREAAQALKVAKYIAIGEHPVRACKDCGYSVKWLRAKFSGFFPAANGVASPCPHCGGKWDRWVFGRTA